MYLFLILFVSPSLSIYVSFGNPYNQGPLPYSSTSISDVPSVRGWLNVYYPTKPDTYAILLFMTGLDSNAPCYSQLESHLPTHGIISVSIQFVLQVPSDELYKTYVSVMDFLAQNLTKYLPSGVIPDVQNSLVGMGHSAGCKIVVKTLLENCYYLKGSILLSPVDGVDPWGWINDFVTHPPDLVNYTTPTLIIGTGLDPVPGHENMPACGPSGRNYERFFTSLRPNMWLLNATNFGHGDILDDVLWETLYLSQFCKTTNDVQGRHYYVQFVSGAIASFVIGTVQGYCPSLQYLRDPTTFPINDVVIDTSKLTDNCPKPTCARV